MANILEYLTPNDLALLTSKADRVVFAKDQPIISEGATSSAVYFLGSGSARVQRGQGMNAVRLATLHPGDVCGEMAFLEAAKSSASVIADEPVTADAVKSPELRTTLEAFPHLGSRFYRSIAVLLSRRLRETSRQLSKAQSAQT